MPVSKKRKFERKKPKLYTFVRFESEIFEGEFELPDISHLPLYIPRSMRNGDIDGKLPVWLAEAGVDEEAIEAIDTLSGEEFNTFMGEWSKGAKVDLPKSKG